MAKVDLKSELKPLYQPSAKEVVEVKVPPLRYLMIDGQGDPSTSPEYAAAVEALFVVAYAAKFKVKKGPQGIDFAVMPLEGLWWAEDMSAFATGARDQWQWTVMILQPDFVSDETLLEVIQETRAKKHLPALDRIRLETLAEGRCAQVMHVGPFTEEGPTLARLHAFIDARSSRRRKHHEIYLSDIRRAAPAKWKTILRQPMA